MAQQMLIHDHKQIIVKLLREGSALLRTIGDQERAQNLDRVRQETDGKTSPIIMFYGLYNAGKSTIINALCQDYVAKVGDVPTTTTIKRVAWEGYTLIDTPGIDAHAEHTEIAENEILESDIILFAMDNADTFDNALVYQTIVKILDMGKPLAVVINQKNVDEEEDPNIPISEQHLMQNIVEKISLNLEIQGQNGSTKLIAQRKNFLGIFPVNGLMAYSACELSDAQDREVYLSLSGICGLKNALNAAIARSQQVYMLQTPLINLRDILAQALQEYQSAPIYGEKQLLAKNRESLLASRQRLRDRLICDGLRKIEAILEQIKTAAASGQSVEDPSQRLGSELNALLKEAAIQEQQVLQGEIKTEAMSGYQAVELDASEIIKSETNGSAGWLAAGGLALTQIPPIIIGPIPIPLNVIVAIAAGFIGLLCGNNHKEDAEAQKAAAESQAKLASYYRWLNELRDQEIKIKANYEKAVNDFLAKSYDTKLEEIDRALAEVDSSCAQHTQNLRQLEQLQFQVSDELSVLAAG